MPSPFLCKTELTKNLRLIHFLYEIAFFQFFLSPIAFKMTIPILWKFAELFLPEFYFNSPSIKWHRDTLRIQSEYRKIQTRNNSVFGHFSRRECFKGKPKFNPLANQTFGGNQMLPFQLYLKWSESLFQSRSKILVLIKL